MLWINKNLLLGVLYNLWTEWVWVFSSSSCSSFMVALSRRNCSCSLYNYFSKFIFNLLISDSDVICFKWPMHQWYNYLTLSFLSSWKVLLFSTFYDYWCSLAPFLRAWSVPVPLTQFIFLCHLPVVKANYFCLILIQNINLSFKIYFCCSCIFSHLRKNCVIFYLIFCDELILVVASWMNGCKSLFYFISLHFILQ